MYLASRTMNQSDLHLDDIGNEMEVGDWKLLYLLSKNMEPIVFGEFLRELHTVLKERYRNNNPNVNHQNNSSKEPLMMTTTA